MINDLLEIAQLEKLPTPRLLDYFKKHRRFRPYWDQPDSADQEHAAYIVKIKEMLDKRGHVVS